MTDDLPTHAAPRPRASLARGQSLVEFGLVLPIMLILLVGIADFGRIFANAVLLEAAARNAAELTSNEYLANPPGPLDAPSTGDAAYYDNLHLVAARAACAETKELPNSNYDPGTTDCPGSPIVMVCVHDSVDPSCGVEVFGATIPAECTDMSPPPTNDQLGTTERWIEVRLCYRFTSIIDLPLVSFGEFWLQRARTFTIPCYFVLGTQSCG